MTHPIVSVIVPVYNTPPSFIRECFNSVLAQSYWKQLELIVFDDGSSIEYKKILKKILAQYLNRISIIFAETHLCRGPSKARNDAIKMASGDYLIFLDSDDVLHPDTIEKCLAYFSDNVDLVYTNSVTMSEDMKNVIHKRDKRIYQDLLFRYKGTICDPLLHSTFVLHARILGRGTFLKVGGIREDVFGGAGNVDLNLRLSEMSSGVNFRLVPEYLYYYRNNPNGVTNNPVLRNQVVAGIEQVISEAAIRRGFDVHMVRRLGRAYPTNSSHYALYDRGQIRIEVPYYDYEHNQIHPQFLKYY